MKYMDKWTRKIVEVIKWDGNIETISNNKWLEDAIKEDKIILGMDDIYDKNPTLLLVGETIVKIKENDYIIKTETHNLDYEIEIMNSKYFEKMFEIVEENKIDAVLIDLEPKIKEMFKNLSDNLKEIKKKFEERELIINNEKYKDSFKVVTKDMFIKDNIGLLDIDSINHQWDKISKGHNFVLFKKDINDMNRYYNVQEFNMMFER